MAVLKRHRNVPAAETAPSIRDGIMLPDHVGVALAVPPLYQSGYAWHTGLEVGGGEFFEHPRELSSNVLWITNQPYNPNLAHSFIKNRFFLRTPIQNLIHELGLEQEDTLKTARILATLLRGLLKKKEAPFLRREPSLTAAIARLMPHIPLHSRWDIAATEALLQFWQGTVRNNALTGGTYLAPRFDTVAQLIRCPIPDFSREPTEYTGNYNATELKHLLNGQMGFVRLSYRNLNPKVADFVDISRIIWTSNEALWLMQHADVSANYLLLTPHTIQHPALEGGFFEEVSPYSWLDGIRAEAAYLAPAKTKNMAVEAWLRANAHLAMAFHAEYLASSQGVSMTGLAVNKIFVAYSPDERESLYQNCTRAGVLFNDGMTNQNV